MIYLDYLDLDEVFGRLSRRPLILNEVDTMNKVEVNALINMVNTIFDGDMTTVLPTCDCGFLTNNICFLGEICEKCGSECKSTHEDEVMPVVWMRRPEYVPKLLNPKVVLQLRDRFKSSGFDAISYLMDPTYNYTGRRTKAITAIKDAGFKRGYTFFVQNFDSIIETLRNLPEFRLPKNVKDETLDLVLGNQHKIWSDYIPVPNKILLIQEKTHVGNYTSSNLFPALQAIWSIAGIEKYIPPIRDRVKENKIAKALLRLSDFIYETYGMMLQKKSGIPRKSLLGSRAHVSMRHVVTNIPGKHEYDECHLPWRGSLMTFTYHIFNKLYRRGYTKNAILEIITNGYYKHSELLAQVFKELIDESPWEGIPMTLGRNPTQLQLSMQFLRGTKVKDEVYDETISWSTMSVSGANCDFDGDQMTAMILTFNKLARLLEPLRGHYGMFDLNEPGKISGNIALTKTVVTVLSNWLAGEDDIDENKRIIMQARYA